MSPRRTVALIASREFGDRLRNKAFMLGTVITAAIFVAAVIIPGLVATDDDPSFTLGLVDGVPDGVAEAAASLGEAQDVTVDTTHLRGREEAIEAVEAGEVDAALLDDRELMADDGHLSTTLRAIVDAALQQLAVSDELARLDLTEEELAGLLAPREPVTVVGPEGEEGGLDPTTVMVALAATILLFLTIQINGNSLLTLSIEEKSSRVVEVLLGTLRPWQLLAGKLVAMTSLALLQIGVIVGAAIGANALFGTFEMPPATGATVAIAIVMLVIGFSFYAALYAVAGSLASSVEDAQATAGPLAFITVGIYMLAVFVVVPAPPEPTSLLAQVLTFVPPTAPFVVPGRVAMEAIAPWQAALAVVVTLVGTGLAVRLAGRLYAAAVLAGGKLTWRDAWKAEPIR